MSYKVFRDAVHNMISLLREGDEDPSDPVDFGDRLLLDLIDTPEFQRLRRIGQLGLARLVYTSGEHSRFSHSLGVLHLAKRILSAILPQGGKASLDRPTILGIKVAALLHDIGHGPFSHVFEHLFAGMASHEEMGCRLVNAPTRIHGVVLAHCERLGVEPRGFLATLTAIMGGKGGKKTALARQLISSQLDADRLDYLLRDAHFTGVSYGRFDLEWLLHSLRVEKVAGEMRLCVDIAKGAAALESYVAARDDMYRQVYHHKTVRAFEVALLHLVQAAVAFRDALGQWPQGTPLPLCRFMDKARKGEEPALDDFLALDDTLFLYAIHHWARMGDTHPAALELAYKCRLIADRAGVYRRLAWHIMGEGEPPAEVIRDPQLARHVEAFFHSIAQETLTVSDDRGRSRSLPLSLLVHVDRLERAPYAHMQYTVGISDSIYVIDTEGRIRPAEMASTHIHFLGQSERRLVRVFVDPRALSVVRALVRDRFRHGFATVA